MISVTNKEPGRRWRILAHRDGGDAVHLEDQGKFDELVVDDWLRIEQMDDNVWWIRVGDVRLFATILEHEDPIVDVERGFHGLVRGLTRTFGEGQKRS
jgi:hypothetical protein